MREQLIKLWGLVRVGGLTLRTTLAMWIMPAEAFVYIGRSADKWINQLERKTESADTKAFKYLGNKLTLNDNTNELKELINEHGFDRVEAIDNLYKGCNIRIVEAYLNHWKELSYKRLKKVPTDGDEWEGFKKIGNYFAYA